MTVDERPGRWGRGAPRNDTVRIRILELLRDGPLSVTHIFNAHLSGTVDMLRLVQDEAIVTAGR